MHGLVAQLGASVLRGDERIKDQSNIQYYHMGFLARAISSFSFSSLLLLRYG